MRKLLLVLALLLGGCSAGEYTLRVANRSDSPIVVTGGRKPVTVAPGGLGTTHISRADGTEVMVKNGEQVLDKLQAGTTHPMPATDEEILYYAGERTRLVLTDLSEFFVIDSAVDQAMAEKNPRVKVAAMMESSPAHLVKKQLSLSPEDKVVKSVPQGLHPYRVVKLPETVPDDQIEEFLQEEFKQAASRN